MPLLDKEELSIEKEALKKIEHVDIAFGTIDRIINQARNVHDKYVEFREDPQNRVDSEHLQKIVKNTLQILSKINLSFITIFDKLLREFPDWADKFPRPVFTEYKSKSKLSLNQQYSEFTDDDNSINLTDVRHISGEHNYSVKKESDFRISCENFPFDQSDKSDEDTKSTTKECRLKLESKDSENEDDKSIALPFASIIPKNEIKEELIDDVTMATETFLEREIKQEEDFPLSQNKTDSLDLKEESLCSPKRSKNSRENSCEKGDSPSKKEPSEIDLVYRSIIEQNRTTSEESDDSSEVSSTKVKTARSSNCENKSESPNEKSEPNNANSDIIDRLGDLISLKRRSRSSSEGSNDKHKKCKKLQRSSSNSSLESNCSDSLTNDTLQNDDDKSSNKIETDPDGKLSEGSDAAEEVEEEEEVNSETDEKNTPTKGSDKKERNKKRLSAEENAKRKWRSDPILNGKLSSDSDFTDEEIKTLVRRKLQFPEGLSDEEISFKIRGKTFFSDSDASDANIRNKLFTPKKKTRKSYFDSSSSNSSDSSDLFASTKKKAKKKKKKSPVKSPVEESDGSDPGSGKKGRKNIRAVIADEDLNEATQKARKQEQERIVRLQQKSKTLEAILSQSEEPLSALVLDADDKTGQPLITVDQKLCNRLKTHQVEGVKFMWNSCFESLEKMKTDGGSGCILAHCMGLGKTFQVITLIHTLFTHEVTNVKRILVVCPLSTVSNWQHEFKIGLKHVEKSRNFSVYTLVGKNEDKIVTIRQWGKSKGVLIVGYEAFEAITNEKKLRLKYSEDVKAHLLSLLVNPGPDLIVCDEGHLLKNGKTLRTKALNRVKTKRRIVLTGTPIQNNLKEYYYMVQFVKPNLLGTYKEYNNSFVNPIENGQYDDSSTYDINMMKRRTHVLQRILKETLQRVEVSELKTYLKSITDYAIFVQLHPIQIKLYKQYITHALQNCYANNKVHFLRDYQMLGLICSHPYLLQLHDEVEKKINKDGRNRQEHDTIEAIQDIVQTQINEGVPNEWWKTIAPNNLKHKLDYGTKFKIMRLIIEECEAVGDKVLIFSQRRVELDAIEHFLQTVGTKNCSKWKAKWDYYRMDGEVPPATRSVLCDRFNDPDNTRSRVFIMSHRVGGLGLNLIAANRVILMSANFNPSYDTQSVYRAYRFGQTKPCFVYRLLAKETMEEKVYQRCITKLAQAGRVVDKHQIQRHYNRDDVSEFYKIIPEENVRRAVPNIPSDGLLAKILQNEESILKFHEHEALLENRPEEDLTDSEKTAAWEEYNKNEEMKMAQTNLAQLQSQIRPFNLNPANFVNQRHAVNLSKQCTIVTAPQSSVCNVRISPNVPKLQAPVIVTSQASKNLSFSTTSPGTVSSYSMQNSACFANSTAHNNAINVASIRALNAQNNAVTVPSIRALNAQNNTLTVPPVQAPNAPTIPLNVIPKPSPIFNAQYTVPVTSTFNSYFVNSVNQQNKLAVSNFVHKPVVVSNQAPSGVNVSNIPVSFIKPNSSFTVNRAVNDAVAAPPVTQSKVSSVSPQRTSVITTSTTNLTNLVPALASTSTFAPNSLRVIPSYSPGNKNIKRIYVRKDYISSFLRENKNVKICQVSGVPKKLDTFNQNKRPDNALSSPHNNIPRTSTIGSTHITKLSDNSVKKYLRKPVSPQTSSNKLGPFKWLNKQVKIYNGPANLKTSNSSGSKKKLVTDKENKKTESGSDFTAIQNRISSNPSISLHPVAKDPKIGNKKS